MILTFWFLGLLIFYLWGIKVSTWVQFYRNGFLMECPELFLKQPKIYQYSHIFILLLLFVTLLIFDEIPYYLFLLLLFASFVIAVKTRNKVAQIIDLLKEE